MVRRELMPQVVVGRCVAGIGIGRINLQQNAVDRAVWQNTAVRHVICSVAVAITEPARKAVKQVLLYGCCHAMVIRIAVIGQLLNRGHPGIWSSQRELCESSSTDRSGAEGIQVGIKQLDVVPMVSNVVDGKLRIPSDLMLHFQVPLREFWILEFVWHIE